VDAECNPFRTTIRANGRSSHRLLKRGPADGSEKAVSDEFDPGDLFLPGKKFSCWTIPNSTSFAGIYTGVFVDSLLHVNAAAGDASTEGMLVHCVIALQ